MTRDQLVPKEILEKLPKLGETANEHDPVAQIKFFYPDFGWTWYGIEFDGHDTFYGFVNGAFPEFGSFSLSELIENRGKLGGEIERDIHFTQTPVSKLPAR